MKKWLSYQNNYTPLDFRYTPQRDILAIVVLLKQEFCKNLVSVFRANILIKIALHKIFRLLL